MDGLVAAFAGAFALGLRHGFDWDHVAALGDITSSDDDTRRALRSSFLYIVGHGLVVTAFGVVAVAAGRTVPPWLDEAMGKVVGATLVGMGVYVVVALVRHGRDARLRSRWMLAWAGVRRAAHAAAVVIRHDHPHPTDAHHHDEDPNLASCAPHRGAHEAKFGSGVGGGAGVVATKKGTHRHEHVHTGPMPADPFAPYTPGAALGVGVLHGVGAETPTQMLLFATAAGAAGALTGSVLVLAFVVGLMVSNTAVALLARAGVLNAARNFAVFATVNTVVAVVSVGLGLLYLSS